MSEPDEHWHTEYRILRSHPAAPGWWAMYDGLDPKDEPSYGPIAAWADCQVFQRITTFGMRNGIRVPLHTRQEWEYDSDEERETVVVGLATDWECAQLSPAGSSTNFLGYVYEPERRQK